MPDAAESMPRHVVVVVRVPDRPGALGSVASRIGSVGANITDVTVGRDAHGDGGVLDTFHLDLPPQGPIDTMGLLVTELEEVDSVLVDQHPGAAGCCRPDALPPASA